MRLIKTLSDFLLNIQSQLFPSVEKELGPLTEKQQKLIKTLEIIQIERFVKIYRGYRGRPPDDRQALARAFVAKSVYNITKTNDLIDRLQTDSALRRICGFEHFGAIPSKATFSRAFHEFSVSKLPQVIHDFLIKNTLQHCLFGHVSRDSTSIEAREKPELNAKGEERAERKMHKRGRPKKGEVREKERRRLNKQLEMSLDEMLSDLPSCCSIGTKLNSKGHKTSWIGYKFHIDVCDGDIPVSCILTSACVHDSQVAIPLATQTKDKITNLYDLMDSAYDCKEIKEHCHKLNHIAIIDDNPRRNADKAELLASEHNKGKILGIKTPEQLRYNERSSVERVNGRIKDEFGGRNIWVKGNHKIMAHLMFGILALTADQLMRYVL